MSALDRALAADPYFLLALLGKGMLLERMRHPRQAARVYKDALKIVPPEDRLPAAVKGAVERARVCVRQNVQDLEAYLGERLRQTRARHSVAEQALRRMPGHRDRVQEALCE